MQHQPAALYRQIETGLVFVRGAFFAKQERPVDQLDVDLSVLNGLDAVGDLNGLPAAFSGSEYGRSEANFIRHPYHANGATKAAKGNAPIMCEVSFAPINGHRKLGRALPKSAKLGSDTGIQPPRRSTRQEGPRSGASAALFSPHPPQSPLLREKRNPLHRPREIDNHPSVRGLLLFDGGIPEACSSFDS